MYYQYMKSIYNIYHNILSYITNSKYMMLFWWTIISLLPFYGLNITYSASNQSLTWTGYHIFISYMLQKWCGLVAMTPEHCFIGQISKKILQCLPCLIFEFLHITAILCTCAKSKLHVDMENIGNQQQSPWNWQISYRFNIFQVENISEWILDGQKWKYQFMC